MKEEGEGERNGGRRKRKVGSGNVRSLCVKELAKRMCELREILELSFSSSNPLSQDDALEG